MKYFALTVDNEVVRIISLMEEQDIDIEGSKTYLVEELDKDIAIYSSDPRVVPIETVVEIGSTWDGQAFTPPVE
jgi:hypothetical protein